VPLFVFKNNCLAIEIMGDKEIYKKAKGFDKHPENINKKGRPKLVSKVLLDLKEKGYEPVTSEKVKYN